jgi:hypothetical protein
MVEAARSGARKLKFGLHPARNGSDGVVAICVDVTIFVERQNYTVDFVIP